MSKKKKKLLIFCTTCKSELHIKRESFKVAAHPMYVKNGQIVINYNKTNFTTARMNKYWLECSRCSFNPEFQTETELIEYISVMAAESIAKTRLPNIPKKKVEVLPKIIRPSHSTESCLIES